MQLALIIVIPKINWHCQHIYCNHIQYSYRNQNFNILYKYGNNMISFLELWGMLSHWHYMSPTLCSTWLSYGHISNNYRYILSRDCIWLSLTIIPLEERHTTHKIAKYKTTSVSLYKTKYYLVAIKFDGIKWTLVFNIISDRIRTPLFVLQCCDSIGDEAYVLLVKSTSNIRYKVINTAIVTISQYFLILPNGWFLDWKDQGKRKAIKEFRYTATHNKHWKQWPMCWDVVLMKQDRFHQLLLAFRLLSLMWLQQ